MKNIRSLNSSPEGLQPSASVEQLKNNPEKSAGLLEVRTPDGPVYLRPTGWQLFWLQRAFRHFRVLPPQVLGSSNQRRINNLLATAVYRPGRPISEEEVFGVVEQVHSGSQLHVVKAAKVPAATSEPATVAPPAVVPDGLALVVQKAAAPAGAQQMIRPDGTRPTVVLPVKSSGFVVQDGSLWHWIVAGAAAAACIPLIMATVYGISTMSSTPQVSAHPVTTPVQQVASQPTQTVPVATAAPALVVPIPEKHRHRLTPGGTQAELINASATGAMTAVQQPRFVSELPPGHFAHPNATGLAGEVRLKAMIGADGSVKQVTVLSGDPRLAQAAERAVMRWHYSPYSGPVAAETEIQMRFFGTDAVSIASVAGPAS